MQLPEFARSTTLLWTLVVAGLFAGFIVAMLGFVYLKTRDDLTARSDRMIESEDHPALLRLIGAKQSS